MPRWLTGAAQVPLILSPMFLPPYGTGLNATGSGLASQAWGTANLALYFPILLPPGVPPLTKLWWQNGGTASGNVDCGMYDAQGNRLVSTGSTAQSGTSTVQAVDITDTVIPSGLLYLALALSSATGTIWGAGAAGAGYGFGVYRQTSAFPLPNPATFATISSAGALLPKFGALVAPRTVI